MTEKAAPTPPRPKPFPGLQAFVFDAPLYEFFTVSSTDGSIELFRGSKKIDGYCKGCKRDSVFYKSSSNFNTESIEEYKDSIRASAFSCSRNHGHVIDLFVEKIGDKIMKVGQSPSVADINKHVGQKYRSVFGGVDQKELSRAIGLAAHGVGIGSYVYLRRIVERLIQRTFTENDHGIDQSKFDSLRMSEKIELLSGKLPPFLVGNKRIYALLSLGIHELTEEDCISYYDILLAAIVEILEEKQVIAEREARKAQVAKALAKIQPGGSGTSEMEKP